MCVKVFFFFSVLSPDCPLCLWFLSTVCSPLLWGALCWTLQVTDGAEHIPPEAVFSSLSPLLPPASEDSKGPSAGD